MASATIERTLLTLMTWLSPAYPVGAFSYSHGLEWAVEEGLVRTRDDLAAWLETLLHHGAGRTDALLLAAAHRATTGGDTSALEALIELAEALLPTAELALEALAQGAAFVRATTATWPGGEGRLAALADRDVVYPLAVGVAAAEHGLGLELTLPAYLHGLTANLVSAGVRLIPLGQTDGQIVLAGLTAAIEAIAAEALAGGLDDLYTSVPMVDWCSMRHETQYTRLFRS
jgi:urease accessory protein